MAGDVKKHVAKQDERQQPARVGGSKLTKNVGYPSHNFATLCCVKGAEKFRGVDSHVGRDKDGHEVQAGVSCFVGGGGLEGWAEELSGRKQA